MSKCRRNSDDVPLEQPRGRVSLGDTNVPRIFELVLAIVLVALVGVSFHPALAESMEELVRPKAELEAERQELIDSQEILWFARALYSETKLADEQRLVAWVVRNRVESKNYPSTYEDVVLDYKQFSGLHEGDDQYELNISREYEFSGRGWDSAISIAREVYFADDSERTIPSSVMHFYSPISASRVPDWAEGVEPYKRVTDSRTGLTRFAFFSRVN